MNPVQAKLIQIARSANPGARLVVLRATEQGIANLLKASYKSPVAAPKPTVLPARSPTTPGVMHTMGNPDGGPTPAALPAPLATEAYVEAGAAPQRTVDRAAETSPGEKTAFGNQALQQRGIDGSPLPIAAPIFGPLENVPGRSIGKSRRSSRSSGGAPEAGMGGGGLAALVGVAVLIAVLAVILTMAL